LPRPLEDWRALNAGQSLRLYGVLYTARDAAHKKLKEAFEQGQPAPFPLAAQTIYYVGPTPPKPGEPIGSAGPTTATRLDSYLELMFSKGMAASIGKGARSPAAVEAHRRWGRVYLLAIGGAGAYLGKKIKAAEVVAYPDLGPEAIYRLTVEDFPAIVAIDAQGRDALALGQARYASPNQT
jgi:fumarate hydratase subunit beta